MKLVLIVRSKLIIIIKTYKHTNTHTNTHTQMSFYRSSYGLGVGIGSVLVGSCLNTVWSLSNIAYAGMRAQGKPETKHQRQGAFIAGLPFTALTYVCVDEGSNRAYGIDLPSNTQ
jgi:hypothetical protein